jgi:hypothetical protein
VLTQVLERSTRRSRRKRIRYAVGGALAAAAAIVVVAVVGTDRPSTEPAPVAPVPPAGTWERTLTDGGAWAGAWSIVFSEGNVLELTPPVGVSPDQVAADGASYVVSEDTLRVDAFSNGACLDRPAGTYRWTLNGDRLFLEAAEEPCPQRQDVFAGVWRRGP